MPRAKKTFFIAVIFMFCLGLNVQRIENASIPAKPQKRYGREVNENTLIASPRYLQSQKVTGMGISQNPILAKYLKGYWKEVDVNKGVLSFYHFTGKEVRTLIEKSSKTYRAEYYFPSGKIQIFQLKKSSFGDDKFVDKQYEYCAGEGRYSGWSEVYNMRTSTRYETFKFNVEAPLIDTPWFYINRKADIFYWSIHKIKGAIPPIVQWLNKDEGAGLHRMERLTNDEYELWKKIMENWTVDYLLQAQKDVDVNVRKCAAEALIFKKESRTVEPLIALLKDEDKDIRRFAAQALGEIGDQRAVEPLIAAMEYQLYAAEALGKIKDPRAIEPLFYATKDKDFSSIDIKNLVIWALKEMEASIPIELLIEGIKKDLGIYVREFSTRALVKRKDPRTIGLLFDLLNEFRYGSKSLTKEIEKALMEMEAHIPIELLIAGRTRGSYSFQKFAGDSLSKLGEPAVESLIALLGHQDDTVRWNACRLLGDIKDTRAIKPLIITLNDKNWDVKSIAATSLGNIGDFRAVEPLIVVLSAQQEERQAWKVKNSAAESLKSITKEDFGQNHKKWRKWWKKSKKKYIKNK